AALAAATWTPVASAWRTIMSSSFSSPSVATAMTSAPCYLTVVRACYGPDRQSSPSDLTKKRATFGPLSHAAVDTGRFAPANPSQLLEITLFFTGWDPASGAGLPRSPQNSAGPKGSQTLELFRSNPGLGGAGNARLQSRPAEKQHSAAQVPGKQWQTKGRGCTQLIVRLKGSPRQAARRSRR